MGGYAVIPWCPGRPCGCRKPRCPSTICLHQATSQLLIPAPHTALCSRRQRVSVCNAVCRENPQDPVGIDAVPVLILPGRIPFPLSLPPLWQQAHVPADGMRALGTAATTVFAHRPSPVSFPLRLPAGCPGSLPLHGHACHLPNCLHISFDVSFYAQIQYNSSIHMGTTCRAMIGWGATAER